MTYCTTMETDQRRGDFGRYFSDTCIFGSFFFAWMYFSIPPPRLWVSIRDGKVSVFFSCTPSVDKNDVS